MVKLKDRIEKRVDNEWMRVEFLSNLQSSSISSQNWCIFITTIPHTFSLPTVNTYSTTDFTTIEKDFKNHKQMIQKPNILIPFLLTFIKSATQQIWSSPHFLETMNMISKWANILLNTLIKSSKFQRFSIPNLHLSQRDRICTGIWMDTSTPKTPWRPIPPR